MRFPVQTSALFVLLGMLLSPPPQEGHASSPPADGVQFCLPVDPEQWQRDEPRPASKWAADLDVGEPRTVRLFYFLPNDRPYRTEVVDSMKSGILDLQSFFAEQMEAHEHGNTTFQIETDDQGDPIVHRVDGDYTDSHYSSRGYTEGEIERAFDNSKNIMLIVMDVSARTAHGRGTGVKVNGWAMIYGEWNWFAAAHELGHSFGLHHDFRDNEYIMSYGRADRSIAKLSACAAEFLSAHPYFNSDVPLENESPPIVELVSSGYPLGAASVPVRLRVRDDDGLRQVILFVRTKNPFLGGTPEVKACHGLSGETDTVVEFNFDGRLPSDNVGTDPEAHTTLSNTANHRIHVVVVDTDGNRTSTASPVYFTLEAGHSPQHVATLDRPYYYNIGGLAISPDGSHLAIGTGGIVELLDARKRESITVFRHTEGNVYVNWSVAFSPDGALLASGSANGTVKLWNVSTRENIATLEGHTGSVVSLDFSTNGTLLASGARDNTVKLWNVATGAHVATLEGHTDGVFSLAFLPDGKLASKAWADGGTVKLWNVTTKSEISTFDTDANGTVAFSPDGAILAAPSRYGDVVKLWDVATGTQIATLKHMREYGYAGLAYSTDGTILAVAANGLIEIWDVPTRELMATVSGGPGGVASPLFSPNGTKLIGKGDKKVKFWDVSEWTAPITPVSQRTSQVREAIVAAVPGVNSAEDVTEAHLAAITILDLQRKGITALKAGDFDGLNSLIRLWLRYNELSALPVGIFDGLTSLTTLYLDSNALASLPVGIFDGLTELRDLHLSDNALTSLPAGIFGGLTELKLIWLRGNGLTLLPAGIFDGLTEPLIELVLSGNAANPLPLTVSLEKVGTNQFKAVAPSGAPFELVLPIRIRNGGISGGATTLTIPVGSAESDTLTVTRTTGTSGAVSVWIGPLPSLPARHTGYRLVKSTGEFRPLELFEDISEQIWSGTITGGTWGNDFNNGNATGFGYSRHHNAGSISNPTFTYRGAAYTIHGISISRIGNNLTHQISLLISPGFPSCDRKLLSFGQLSSSGGLPLADAGEGSAYGASWYLWRERSHMAWPVGFQYSWKITLHPTAPDAPAVTAINEGNQVLLSWTTPCDGGKDITRHEYRQKTRNGAFGSWIPIPNSGAGGVNLASYTLAVVNNPQEHIFEVRAVNELGEGLVSTPVSPSDRTTQVAEAILNVVKLDYPSVTSFADITDIHLAGITALYLNRKNITALKSGDFKGLTSVTELRLNGNQLTTLPEGIFSGLTALRNLNLYNNRLSGLPAGLFAGLTSLTTIRLDRNAVVPLPLIVSLEKVADGQFKAVAPSGAPFDLVLPLTVANGSISGGATTITIPAGSVESAPHTVTRNPGTTAAVTVDIGALPGLPNGHYGYTLVKSADLPLEIVSIGTTGATTAATDFNGDGRTDFVDFFLFADAYGGNDARFDLDGNGTVDFADFFKFVDAFGS